MKWRTLSDQRDLHPLHWIWLGPPVAVAIVLFVPPIVASVWLEQQKRRLMGPSAEWRPWFAWFPIVIDEPAEWPRRTVWLEWVERRLHYGHVTYRPTPRAAGSEKG